jgi:hypothetical protein
MKKASGLVRPNAFFHAAVIGLRFLVGRACFFLRVVHEEENEKDPVPARSKQRRYGGNLFFYAAGFGSAGPLPTRGRR